MRKPVVWLTSESDLERTGGPATGTGLRSRERQPVNGMLPRPRLVDLIACGPPFPTRLNLVLAPPGFGKTVLLRQVAAALETSGVTISWLACPKNENCPERFLRSLCSSLEAAGLVPSRTTPSPDGLSRVLARATIPGVIVIDEYEHACSAENDGMLLELAHVLPPGLMILVATRRRPNLALARGEVSGDLQVIDGRALRFAADEVPGLLAGCGNVSDVEAIIEMATYRAGHRRPRRPLRRDSPRSGR